MALLENCRVEIAEYNGLNLLIDFLMETPYSYMADKLDASKTNESELSACERVLQKAAIAISRFCREPKYSILLVELGGKYIIIQYFERNDKSFNKSLNNSNSSPFKFMSRAQ